MLYSGTLLRCKDRCKGEESAGIHEGGGCLSLKHFVVYSGIILHSCAADVRDETPVKSHEYTLPKTNNRNTIGGK